MERFFFRRIKTREGFENVPHWEKGYEFEVKDLENSSFFVVDETTETIHLREHLEFMIRE